MILSFLDYLRTGELPPIRFGTSRSEVLRLLGVPTDWVSGNDRLFQPPQRWYDVSDAISFGSLTFSFDAADQVESMMLCHLDGCEYPPGSIFFPEPTATVHDIACLMRVFDIPFKDTSYEADGSELRTASGVVISGLGFLYCDSERPSSAKRVARPRAAEAEGS